MEARRKQEEEEQRKREEEERIRREKEEADRQLQVGERTDRRWGDLQLRQIDRLAGEVKSNSEQTRF